MEKQTVPRKGTTNFRVLNMLEKYKNATGRDFIHELDITNYTSPISELRHRYKIPIKSEIMRTLEGKYAVYTLIEKRKP